MQSRLSLRYSGPAVESGLMDVYQASSNMLAFSEFVVAAAKSVYGEQVQARAEVAGFGRGSFVTDIVFNVAGPAATIFATIAPNEYLEVIKQAIALWKHLRGEPPKAIVHNGDQQTVNVENNNGQILQIRTNTLNLVYNEKSSEAVHQFIGNSLSREGMDAVEIGSEDGVLASATQSEAAFFVPVLPSETVTDTAFQMTVIIEAPVFKDGNKWRFSDGSNSFFADIHDREFLARVDAGERFGKGDLLVVQMRITQERSGPRITTARAVERVIEHRPGQEQTSLFTRP